MALILVIDDDPLVHHRFRRDFEDTGIKVLTAGTAAEGLDVLNTEQVDLVILDVLLPDLSGLDTFGRIHEQDATIPVVFITSSTESATAIQAMKAGAYDYLLKPLDRRQVLSLVSRAIEIRELMKTPVDLPDEVSSNDGQRDLLVGRCAGMQEVYKEIGRVASQDVMVLIQGESGTGKELVARAIYHHSARSKGPFLAINCAAIPDALLESELFGHEKGAFTGAEVRRIGKFEQCSGGTLFLDEIGDMTQSTQSKVLRVLQEQKFERVGGSETIATDVRIIAATHRDLRNLVASGSFREDLYYRLNVFAICLPPLRERRSDFSLLLQHFLNRFSRDLNKNVQSISPEALDLLLNYDWPGNIREFQSVIKQSLLHATGPVLMADFLPNSFRERQSSTSEAHEPAGQFHLPAFVSDRLRQGSNELYNETMNYVERELITAVLEFTAGNRQQAARILGITRSTLRNKMNMLGIKIESAVESQATAVRTVAEDSA